VAERSYVAENNASRARLSTLAARLNDADLAQPIGHGWTVSVALAHLAFWDHRNLATVEEWEHDGVQVTRVDPDPINDTMLPQWLAMPPRQALSDALAAAEAVDHKVENLPAEMAAAILERRPRTIIRAIHRNEHLDEIERALAR